jgi:hypothetical protein
MLRTIEADLKPQMRLSERWVVLLDGPRASIAIDTASILSLGKNEFRVWLTTRYSDDRELAGDRFASWRDQLASIAHHGW